MLKEFRNPSKKQMMEQSTFFESLLMDLEDAVIAIDCNWNVMLLNQAAQKQTVKLFGKEIKKGTNLRKEFSDTSLECWQKVLQSKTIVKESKYSQRLLVSVTYFPVVNSRGNLIGACSLIKSTESNNTPNERFQTLVNASQSTVWWTDDLMHFVQPQSHWETITGQSRDQYTGMGWIQAIHPDDRDRFLQQLDMHRKSKNELETTLSIWNQKLKQYRTVSIKVVPCLDAEGSVVEWIGSCLDVHRVKELEQELEEKNRDYDMLADSMPDMVWTSKPDGAVDFFNKRFLEFAGMTRGQPNGWGWKDVIHPDDLQNCVHKWTTAFTTGTKYEIKYRLVNADGTSRWHLGRAEPLRDSSGKIVKWFGTCTDIEDLVQVESKLLRVTEQLNLTLKSAHIGVWSWDLQTNTVSVDDNVLVLFNLDRENFRHTSEEIIESIHPEDRQRVEVALKKLILGNVPFDTEFRIQATDRVVAARSEVFRNANGEATRMIGINWDITSRKRLEQESIKALQFAEEQERKRAQEAEAHRRRLEEFIDVICHEIRNPLNGITGMISLMGNYLQPLMDGESSEPADMSMVLKKALECINTIERCAEQQKVIVDDVLDLSKAESDKLELSPTVFNPKSLLESLQTIFSGLVEHKNLETIIDIAPEADRFFRADSKRLSQILINLQSNSIKFTEIGYVYITVTKDIKDSKCFLCFSVKDTGIGMTDDEVSKLFNKFSQGNPGIGAMYGGSGLGLAISKKLVELMGGTFVVTSEKGRGSQFHFTIQCAEVTDHEIMRPPPTLRPSSPLSWNISSKSILIVEDNVINQKILTNYLQQQNCLYHLANNGVEALNKCDEYPFDVIFMDLEMPVMGGLEATQKIREKKGLNHNTAIIGLSGNARKEHMEEALKCGMNDYLTKPYHKTDIYKAVTKFCTPDSMDRGAPKKRKMDA